MEKIIKLAPIVIFVYNRPVHTKKTIQALIENDLSKDSDLYIFSDGPKNNNDIYSVNSVRNYIKNIKGFKKITIIEREYNLGLAGSIISGVSEIVNKYGSIIVLEDDLVTSRFFLKFMNESLDKYKNNKKVGMIHGHIYNISNLPETFFIYKAGCLGWGTWDDRWELVSFDGEFLIKEIHRKKLAKKFDVNYSYDYTRMLKDQIKGKNNSWAIRLYASFLLNDLLVFYPGRSLLSHIGFDIGTHCNGSQVSSDMDGVIYNDEVKVNDIEIKNSEYAIKKIQIFYDGYNNNLIKKMKIFIKRLVF